jgi:tetratricopeptide (TPR) repeat protein
MKATAKLKEEARRHEQREDWERAIQAYLQVLRDADGGEAEHELPLYNRIGDLYVRMGRQADAVKYYEQAADRYAEAGLYNNAIALCNKALRHQPQRLALFRKLGQFCAHQGFLTDARRWYVEYAERMFKQGELDEAFDALEDFANISEDAEIREHLGRQLYLRGRPDEGLAELRRAYAMHLRAGDVEAAGRLRDEVLALADDAPDLAAEEQTVLDAPAARPGAAAFGLPGIGEVRAEPADAAGTAADAPPAGFAATSVVTAARGDAGTVEGLESTSLGVAGGPAPETGTVEGLDTGRDDTLEHLRGGVEAEPADEAAPLPLLGDASDEDDGAVSAAAPSTGPGPAELPRLDAPDLAATPAAAGDAGYVDLFALLDPDADRVETTRFFVQETEPTGDEDRDFAQLLSQFRQKLAEHVAPEDAGSHYDLGLAFKEMGLIDDAINEFQIALRAGEDRLKVFEELGQCFFLKDQYNIAIKILSRALQLDHRDELEMIGVYYHLGRSHEALGHAAPARDAYERVMGLDIRFKDVMERIGRL